MQFARTVLPNGLRLITIPMPSFESATVLVMVGAGSRYETRKNNGISHFLEHMAFKGTKKRPSALSISTLIDGIGGECNAFTGKEITGYYIKSSATHVELSMDILSDMLQKSLLHPKEIDKERGVIIEEINLYEDTPARKIGDIYENLLYGDTPLGWDIAGEKDVIKSIARKDFVAYLTSLYSAHNITVVVAGGVNNKHVGRLAEKYFGKMKKFDIVPHTKVVENQMQPGVLIKKKTTEQVHIALGVRTVGLDHKDHYPLALLSAILGGGMSSRLFNEVREKRGLAYYVRAHSDHYQEVGSLTALAGVDPKKVEEAVKVIIDEFRAIGEGAKAVTNEELKKAKEFVKGHMVLELEDSRAVASFFAHQELLETHIDTPEQVLGKIDAVTVDEVKKAAKKYLTSPAVNLAVIGNFSDRQRFEKLIR